MPNKTETIKIINNDLMYEEVYNKIVNYLGIKPKVFKTIVTGNRTPTFYYLYIHSGNIHISSPKNTPNPTKINNKLSKNDFYKIYPLYLEYLKDNNFSKLQKRSH